jgi:hypothetical protein
MAPTSAEETDALFKGPRQDFVVSRDALARRLAADGRDEDARVVKALRKPTASAWALNQLSHRDPEGVESLLDAGASLRAAQRTALSSSGNAAALRTAAETRREAIGRLARLAEQILTEAGASGSHGAEIISGLEAASVDETAGATLRKGTFSRPPVPVTGFEEGPRLTSVPTGARTAHPPERIFGAQAEVVRLRRDRDATARRARKDRALADGYAQELQGLTARLAKLKEKRAEAEQRARAGERELKKADAALRRSER